MDTPEQAAARIEGRKQAEQLLALIADDMLQWSPEGQLAFWETWRNIALYRAPLPTTTVIGVIPFDEREAKEFGQETCPFAAHQGERWDDVSRGYLYFLTDSVGKTIHRLRRYLASDRVRREAHAEPEEAEEII